MQLGAYDNGSGPQFNMTALALRAAKGVNAVSQLHGVVTREMWGPIWPGTPERAAGARDHQRHPHADVALERDGAAVRRLPAGGLAERHDEPSCGRRARHPDEALWTARNALRQYLFAFIRERARLPVARRAGQRGRVVGAGRCSIPTR
jgi:starch phosphorylase